MNEIKLKKWLVSILIFSLIVLLVFAWSNRKNKINEDNFENNNERENINLNEAEKQLEQNSEIPIVGDKANECSLLGGKYLPEYKECEGISETDCQNLGGKHVECGSACRHNPDPNAICIMMCVAYCKW